MAIRFGSAQDADVAKTLEEYEYPEGLLDGARDNLQASSEALTELPQRIAALRKKRAKLDPSKQTEISDIDESIALIQSSLDETPENINQFKNDITALEEMLERRDLIRSSATHDLLTMTISAQASKAYLKAYKENLQSHLAYSKKSWQRSFLTKLIAKVDSALHFKTMEKESDVTFVISRREFDYLRNSLLSTKHVDILKKVSITPSYSNLADTSRVISGYNASVLKIIKNRLDVIQKSLSHEDNAKWLQIISQNPPPTLSTQLNDVGSGSMLGRLIGLNAIYEQALIQNNRAPNKSISIVNAVTKIANSFGDDLDGLGKFESSISKHSGSRNPISRIRGSQFSQMMSKIEDLQKTNRLPSENFRGIDVRPTRETSSRPRHGR